VVRIFMKNVVEMILGRYMHKCVQAIDRGSVVDPLVKSFSRWVVHCRCAVLGAKVHAFQSPSINTDGTA
jgi:hypothetical protein